MYCCVHVFWGLAHPLSRAAGPAQGFWMLVCILRLLLVLTVLVNCKVFMIYLTGVRCHAQHVLIRAMVTWCRYRKPNPFAVPPMRQGSRSCCFCCQSVDFRMLNFASMSGIRKLMFDGFKMFQSFHAGIWRFCMFPRIIFLTVTWV